MRTDPRDACANERQRLLWALIHDGLAHPLMALTGYCKAAVAFHDWTSHKAWPRESKVMFYGCDRKRCAEIEYQLRSQGVAFVVTTKPNRSAIDPYGSIFKVELL